MDFLQFNNTCNIDYSEARKQLHLNIELLLIKSNSRIMKFLRSFYHKVAKLLTRIFCPVSVFILISAGLLPIFCVCVFVCVSLLESITMGGLGSRLQTPSQAPEEAAEGTSTGRKHGCECKRKKRNAPCDCDSEAEDDDSVLDTPRRQVHTASTCTYLLYIKHGITVSNIKSFSAFNFLFPFF